MGLLDDLDQLMSSQKVQGVSNNAAQRRLDRVGQSSSKEQQQRSERIEGGYEAWSLGKLQSEARRYGFKPSGNRQSLIKQRYRVQEALEKEAEDVGDVSMISSSFLGCSSVELISDDEYPMGDLTRSIISQANKSPRQAAREYQSSIVSEECPEEKENENDDKDNEPGRVEEEISPLQTQATLSPTDIAPSLSKQLYKAITSDKALYHRILLFEPVSFDEVSSTAKRAGVTGLKSKEVLRNWLDMQGICFYSAELTGPRHRH